MLHVKTYLLIFIVSDFAISQYSTNIHRSCLAGLIGWQLTNVVLILYLISVTVVSREIDATDKQSDNNLRVTISLSWLQNSMKVCTSLNKHLFIIDILVDIVSIDIVE